MPKCEAASGRLLLIVVTIALLYLCTLVTIFRSLLNFVLHVLTWQRA